jgi:hypothetical protein
MKTSLLHPRELRLSDGRSVSLPLEGISTGLVIAGADGETIYEWRTGVENCHSLVPSPTEEYVAFVCELNGVIVMKLSANGGLTTR